ncbi:MAG: Na+/H+ antiporter NhaA [Bacteroidetes bacterium]|nr:MAG: Na+/H+ antiporter NhaA [Bacteroidota bacterium]
MKQHVPRSRTISVLSRSFRDFITSSTAGGVILLAVTVTALVWANSGAAASYFALWETNVTFAFGGFSLSKTLHHWINDGLMVIFFFMVGLEIKREIAVGELASFKKALLPILAAVGGMAGPALVYLIFNAGTPAAHGWGIPMATDIAFALGVLALAGDRVPPALKVFLAALAIVDDMGAVLVIALFYTSELSLAMLAAGAGVLVLLFIANRMNVRSTAVYLLLGLALWFCFLKSGVHATVAGVLLAMMIPVRSRIDKSDFLRETKHAVERLENDDASAAENELIHHVAAVTEDAQSPLHRMEHALQPYVAFLIMPVFALANAGVALQGDIAASLISPVALGVGLGLIIGKQAGIFGITWLAVRTGVAVLPSGVSWPMIYALTWLCAIGFTMALFIAGLAFTDPATMDVAKIAILAASTVAGVAGMVLVKKSTRRK